MQIIEHDPCSRMSSLAAAIEAGKPGITASQRYATQCPLSGRVIDLDTAVVDLASRPAGYPGDVALSTTFTATACNIFGTNSEELSASWSERVYRKCAIS